VLQVATTTLAGYRVRTRWRYAIGAGGKDFDRFTTSKFARDFAQLNEYSLAGQCIAHEDDLTIDHPSNATA
jgi:hypothetical protein